MATGAPAQPPQPGQSAARRPLRLPCSSSDTGRVTHTQTSSGRPPTTPLAASTRTWASSATGRSVSSTGPDTKARARCTPLKPSCRTSGTRSGPGAHAPAPPLIRSPDQHVVVLAEPRVADHAGVAPSERGGDEGVLPPEAPGEGRGVPERRHGVRPRHDLPGDPQPQQGEVCAAAVHVQGLHLPDVPRPGLLPPHRRMPPGHQAAEPAAGPGRARRQAVRLWQRETPRRRPAERRLHLLAVLPGARADLRGDRLHHHHRHMVHGMRLRGDVHRQAIVPRRGWRRPARRDHQGPPAPVARRVAPPVV